MKGGNVLALITIVFAAGCSTASHQTRIVMAPPVAVVDVVNRSPYAWKLTFQRDGPHGRVVAVPAGRMVSVEIAAGSYRIEQEPEGVSSNAGLSRSIEEKFEAGQHYRWPLLTLLSEPAPPAVP